MKKQNTVAIGMLALTYLPYPILLIVLDVQKAADRLPYEIVFRPWQIALALFLVLLPLSWCWVLFRPQNRQAGTHGACVFAGICGGILYLLNVFLMIWNDVFASCLYLIPLLVLPAGVIVIVLVRYVRPRALRIASAVVTGLSGFLAGAITLILLFFAVFFSLGANTIVRSIPSPNGAYIACVVDGDYGATGGATLVEVKKSSDTVHLVLCDLEPAWRCIYTTGWGKANKLVVEWADETTVLIDGEPYKVAD